jgi:hypothetical protein
VGPTYQCPHVHIPPPPLSHERVVGHCGHCRRPPPLSQLLQRHAVRPPTPTSIPTRSLSALIHSHCPTKSPLNASPHRFPWCLTSLFLPRGCMNRHQPSTTTAAHRRQRALQPWTAYVASPLRGHTTMVCHCLPHLAGWVPPLPPVLAVKTASWGGHRRVTSSRITACARCAATAPEHAHATPSHFASWVGLEANTHSAILGGCM